MKIESEYKVYVIDTDGSERCGGTVYAKSIFHAILVAKRMNIKKISYVLKN